MFLILRLTSLNLYIKKNEEKEITIARGYNLPTCM